MPLYRKIQVIAVAFGGFLTQLLGLAQLFDAIHWSGDQMAGVGVTYASFVAFVVVVAQVLGNVETEEGH